MIDVKTVQLGQKVRVRATLCREDSDEKLGFQRARLVWKRRTPGTIDAVVVGVRTLSNGIVSYSFEDGVGYRAKEHFPALLVSFDLRRKPVFALPDDVEEA